jgi:hypothetical protein
MESREFFAEAMGIEKGDGGDLQTEYGMRRGFPGG